MWILYAVLIVAAVLIVGFLAISLIGKAASTLTPAECKVRELVREAYRDKITNERIALHGKDHVFIAGLQKHRLKEVQVNLTSLARKLEHEGVSLAALRKSIEIS